MLSTCLILISNIKLQRGIKHFEYLKSTRITCWVQAPNLKHHILKILLLNYNQCCIIWLVWCFLNLVVAFNRKSMQGKAAKWPSCSASLSLAEPMALGR